MTASRDETTENPIQASLGRSKWLSRIGVAGLYTGLVALLWGLDTLTKVQSGQRLGLGTEGNVRLYAEQATSAAAVLLMVVFVIFWVRRFPFSKLRLWALPAYLVGSVVFTLGHYFLMVFLRAVLYPRLGMDYQIAYNHLGNLFFEYQKDLKIYLGLVLIAALQIYFRRGKRSPTDAPVSALAQPRKLAVPTQSGERLIAIEDIDYLEAAGNYVKVHSRGNRYLLRSSLKAVMEQLPEEQFVRLHRSFLANTSKLREFRSLGTRQVVEMRDGAELPVSKRYRRDARAALAQQALG